MTSEYFEPGQIVSVLDLINRLKDAPDTDDILINIDGSVYVIKDLEVEIDQFDGETQIKVYGG